MTQGFVWLARVVVFIAVLAPLYPSEANAFSRRCPSCVCAAAEHAKTRDVVTEEHIKTRLFFGTSDPLPPQRGRKQQHGTGRLGLDQNWWIDLFFIEYLLPALQMMTEQLVGLMMNQALSIGAMIDAKHQMETQMLFDQLKARAHKDYQPSMSMCIFGTNVRSLAAADRNTVLSTTILSNRPIDRQLGTEYTAAAEGPYVDRQRRLGQFIETFCDPNYNNRIDGRPLTGLTMLCGEHMDEGTRWVRNMDVDFTRTIMMPRTLRLDMVNHDDNDDAEAVFAMAANLYSHDVLSRITGAQLQDEGALNEIMDIRALAAKRSVAQQAFHSIVGLKTMGTKNEDGDDSLSSEDTRGYMAIIMEDMGIEPGDIPRILGERPSYFAQLEFLAKTMYQRPGFYADLYDKPANIRRRKVAMQAINSMLDREIYNSYLRSEAILSQILELSVTDYQASVQDMLDYLPVGQE